jgi:hypothetical protein
MALSCIELLKTVQKKECLDACGIGFHRAFVIRKIKRNNISIFFVYKYNKMYYNFIIEIEHVQF